MAHQRKLIRKAVAAMLIAGNTLAQARVSTTRIQPHKKSQLPALSVYTLSDSTKEWLAPRELTRELNLEIAGWVAHADSYTADDQMDDLAEQVEAVLNADWYLTAFFAVTAVNQGASTLTIPNHGLGTGAAPAALVSSGSVPGGTMPTPTTQYYVIVVDANTIQLATSLANADVGTFVPFTSAGSGTIQLAVSTAADSILSSTEMKIVEEEAHSDPTIGVVTLTYTVTFRTSAAAPLGLPAFSSASVTINPNNTPNIPTYQNTFTP